MSRQGQTLEPWSWLGVPTLCAIVALMLLDTPFRLLALGLPEPMVPMALAFAWAVIRPSVLGPIALFVLGLFTDLLWNGPLGLWAVALIAAHGLAIIGRNLMAGQGGAVLMAWYLAACCLGFGVAYLLATIASHDPPSLFATAWQLLWTAALFPIVHWLTDRYEDADVRFR
jgi:rod shape-determining protein MreD